jgi:AcrR family transcriptional regulator
MTGRDNQRKRTRKAILEAANRLAGQGRAPTLEEVAEAAMVSRATAYRYFPSVEALMVEAALDFAFPDVDTLLADAPDDPAIRLARAERAFHEMIYGHEAALRLFVAHSLGMKAGREDGIVRQNRRTPFIEATLAPVRARLGEACFERLVNALAILMGSESMIVCRDVLGIAADEALDLTLWASQALLSAALAESA